MANEDVSDYERPDYLVNFLQKNKIKIPRNKKEFEKLIKDYEKEKFGRRPKT